MSYCCTVNSDLVAAACAKGESQERLVAAQGLNLPVGEGRATAQRFRHDCVAVAIAGVRPNGLIAEAAGRGWNALY